MDILRRVNEMRALHPRMGSRSLHVALGLKQIGITKFEQFMSRYGLTVNVKRKRIVTTKNGPGKRYPNLTNGKELNGINQLIVVDITYYIMDGKTIYITILKDFYSKRIVGIHASETMDVKNVIKPLKQLFKLRKIKVFVNLTHHSDGGSQFKSKAYTGLLNSRNISISMAKSCLENGSAEQINGVIKNDYLLNKQIKTIEQLNMELRKIQYLINEQKPVASLNYMTPVAFENYISGLKEQDRPITKCYDFKQKRGVVEA